VNLHARIVVAVKRRKIVREKRREDEGVLNMDFLLDETSRELRRNCFFDIYPVFNFTPDQ
jgi:hypothetical protein